MSTADSRNPHWRTTPDGFRMEVPAGWTIDGAGPVPTSPNRHGLEGALKATPVQIGELLVGRELPDALFRASGVSPSGVNTGFTVGVYELGSPVSLVTLRQEILSMDSDLAVEPSVFSGFDGLCIRRKAETESSGGDRAMSECWGTVPHLPSSVVAIRFWTGAGGDDTEVAALHDRISDSFAYVFPAWFSGLQRPFTLKLFAPADAVERDHDGWRLSGWRLGEVYRSRILNERQALAASHVPRQSDIRLVALAFLPWLVGALALLGWEDGKSILLLGTIATLSAVAAAQKLKWRAAAGLAVVLVVLLGVGVGTR